MTAPNQTHTVNPQNAARLSPSRTPEAHQKAGGEMPKRWLSVNRVPTIKTMWDAVIPVAARPEKSSDTEVLRAWKYAAVANYMMRMCIEPRGFLFSQRHQFRELGKPERLETVEAVARERGLLDKFAIEIHLLTAQ